MLHMSLIQECLGEERGCFKPQIQAEQTEILGFNNIAN